MKRLISIAVFASLVVVGQSVDAKPKVGILGLEPVDDSGQANKKLNLAARVMTTLIRQVARQDSPAQYEVPESAFQEFLEVKILYDCTIAKVACLVPIGTDLKVDFLVYGRVTLMPGQGYEVSLNRLNVNGKREEGRAEEIVPFSAINSASDNANQAQKWARLLWNRVNGREVTGSITVTSNALEGKIIIGGKRVGKLVEGRGRVPMVKPGDRKIRIESTTGSATGTVSVKAGEDSEIELNVSANVGPGGPGPGPGPGGGPIDGGGGDSRTGWKIAFAVGLVGTAGLGGGAYYYGNFRNGKQETPCKTDPGACDRGRDFALYGTIGTVSSITFGVATLFFGYKAFVEKSDRTPQEGVGLRKKRQDPVVRIVPIGPGDIGGSLEITF